MLRRKMLSRFGDKNSVRIWRWEDGYTNALSERSYLNGRMFILYVLAIDLWLAKMQNAWKVNAHSKFLPVFIFKVARECTQQNRWKDRTRMNTQQQQQQKRINSWKIDALLNSHILFAFVCSLFQNIMPTVCIFVRSCVFFHAIRDISLKNGDSRKMTHWIEVRVRAMKEIHK